MVSTRDRLKQTKGKLVSPLKIPRKPTSKKKDDLKMGESNDQLTTLETTISGLTSTVWEYDDETEVHGRTSAMIKNIPTKLSRTKLIELLDIHCGNENKRVDEQYLGLESCQEEIHKFDFVYLPINFRTGLNLGYAFVNFTRFVEAVRFFRCFQNFGWKSFDSRKVCEMKLARVQRAWLLKLLALELQTGDMTSPTHREMCQNMLSQIFVCDMGESELDLRTLNPLFLRNDPDYAKVRSITKTKVLELLDVFLFRSPDTSVRYSQFVLNTKYNLQVENILGNPSTSEKGGVYYYSERGDRLIDLASFRDRLWQVNIPHYISTIIFGLNVWLHLNGEEKQHLTKLLKVEQITKVADGHSVVVCEGEIFVPCRLATVASGVALVKLLEYKVGGAHISLQTAYGVKVEVENNPYDPNLMVFMYCRDYMKQKVQSLDTEYPTFRYVMPMFPSGVFFEETLLASRDAMPFDLLKKKLMSQLETMGM
ncbi:hypothetical protein GIB67_026639 [Kingdonia uniflora]|uniref:Mei2-like C-terminal RNA recognition motif domain-containing protein n=1 Tax=Kingdonia uniflora TaxID=39325 RepID=A0A7J7NIM5_9MAGN|nr:hypothetical protein GIB67_026639 [Kingdonia uniflora]